jgi:hypothetical protein
MKKIIFFLVILLIVGCVACIKDPIDPKYIIEASAGLGGIISPSGRIEVVSGDNLNFTLSPDPGFKADSITVNGVNSPLTGNTFDLSNITNDYKVEITFKKTLSWYAMQGAWNKDSVIIKEDDGTWTHHLSSAKDSVFFLPTGRYNTYRNGKLIGDGNWSISELTVPATFNYGGFIWRIEELNDVSLILATNDFKDIYSHH